jgi:hypothetical protein
MTSIIKNVTSNDEATRRPGEPEKAPRTFLNLTRPVQLKAPLLKEGRASDRATPIDNTALHAVSLLARPP